MDLEHWGLGGPKSIWRQVSLQSCREVVSPTRLFSMIGASGNQQSLEDTCMPLLEEISPHFPQQENQSPGQAHT